MSWYLLIRGRTQGPFDDDAIIRSIEAGRIRDAQICGVGAESWAPLVSYPPFAEALRRAVPPPDHDQGDTAHKGKERVAVWLSAGALVCVFVFFYAIASDDDATSSETETVYTPVPEPEPEPATAIPEKQREPSVGEKLMATTSLNRALKIMKPHMGDTTNGSAHPSAAVFALWASANLDWKELVNMPDTRRAAVMKDPDRYRGRRICNTGSIVEIHTDRSAEMPLYHGGMMTRSFDMVRFIAVRSSGDLVAQDNARFCGIIIGLQSYPNVSGGQTHAVYVVGMFDLPENHGQISP